MDTVLVAGGAICATLLVYGAWLCLRSGFGDRPLHPRPEAETEALSERAIGASKRP
jgi:hypothetical protein